MLEVDTAEITIEVSKRVLLQALGATSEKDAQIIGATSRGNGHTVEFACRDARDAAHKAMRVYGQLPCTRPAEVPPLRTLSRVHAIDCVAWVGTGKCSITPTCPFRHPPPVARVPCRHWIRNHGECWYAEHCNFLHPGSAAARNVHDMHDACPPAPAPAPGHPHGQPTAAGAGGGGPATIALTSPPHCAVGERRQAVPSFPWATSSAIPIASSLPANPRDGGGGGDGNEVGTPTHANRVIGSPWTARASTATARPPTPDIYGRPVRTRMAGAGESAASGGGGGGGAGAVSGDPHGLFSGHGRGNAQPHTQLSSSISSVDDEIISGGGRGGQVHDGHAKRASYSGPMPGAAAASSSPHSHGRCHGNAEGGDAAATASTTTRAASVWRPPSAGPRFDSTHSSKRLNFGSLPVTHDDDDGGGGGGGTATALSALRLQLSAKDAEIGRLQEALKAKDHQIATLSSQLAAFHTSTGQPSPQLQPRAPK